MSNKIKLIKTKEGYTLTYKGSEELSLTTNLDINIKSKKEVKVNKI